MSTHVWLRAEQKTGEKRIALTPALAEQMLTKGWKVTVERSTQACYTPEQFAAVGCQIVAAGEWQNAPAETIVLGLKELNDECFPLKHRHIHFAHVYKNQRGWDVYLRRFSAGGGTLYDLEYLVDEQQRRIAAFGYWAGYAGAALALLAWCAQQTDRLPVLLPVSDYPDRAVLLEELRAALKQTPKTPAVLVMGALGRSGQGAVELLREAGAKVIAWDIQQSQSGGPFKEITDADVFVNCVFVQKAIPPFVTDTSLAIADRQLSIICDVSCDPYGEYNPVPVYQEVTSFAKPVLRLIEGARPLDLIAIDHLPSMLPKESTDDYVSQLAPYLLTLDKLSDGVWQRAETVFNGKLEQAVEQPDTHLK
ncbi:MAG: saccharopine dehydrogenase [Granulosicoccus sp.]|nr:saccharopine dehydrogenase [Granulosicoccus sp.]